MSALKQQSNGLDRRDPLRHERAGSGRLFDLRGTSEQKITAMKHRPRFLVAKRGRARHPTSFQATTSGVSFKPHPSWGGAMLFAAVPTARFLLCLDDITSDSLIIRCSKFRKSRLVPLHETAQAGLERYLQTRRSFAPFDNHVFVSLRRRRLLVGDAETAFHQSIEKIGLPRGPGNARPTIHSLRHSFAVRALETCPDGRDRIAKHMVALSTYLGHSKVADTYWYRRRPI
jgi:hypothetical protein